ncbi:MAG: DUF167 domain-containing protein [Betaproteobacteria bacterium]|nr:DUF167 domain-containing protein [Betaproteobacteria bacterium]
MRPTTYLVDRRGGASEQRGQSARADLFTGSEPGVAGAIAWRREDGADLVLALHVQPGAKRTGVAGTHGEGDDRRLKLRLAAPPVDGKGERRATRYLAAAFEEAAQRNVTLWGGETSRQKTVRVVQLRAAPRPRLGRQSEGETT